MKQKRNLVIGLGEVGTAIQNILNCDGHDAGSLKTDKYQTLHICFPYSEKFLDHVINYQEYYGADLVIVHSTVPVGTCSKIGAVHSPVRGIHPHLEAGIRTFVKYFGGEQANKAAKIFADLGLTTKTTPRSETTEALKLWDTTIYGWNIILEKFIHEWCEDKGLDFEMIYTDANKSYNAGYEQLGHPEYKKYILKHFDGPIGGHCVVQNANLLDSQIADIILNFNGNI
jgi:hypothetical protein